MHDWDSSLTIDRSKLRKERVENVRRLMKERRLDALIATSCGNIRYITDNRLYYLFDYITDGYAAFLAPDQEPITMAHVVEGEICGVWPPVWDHYPLATPLLVTDRICDHYAKALRMLKVTGGRIGIDSASFVLYEKLAQLAKSMPNTTLVPVMEDLLRIRAIKGSEEIKLLRRAAEVVDVGMRFGLDHMKPGITEKELLGRMVGEMRCAGSEIEPWPACLHSGESGLRSFFPTDKKLKDGEMVSFDIGCIVDGYHGDGARSAVLGAATKGLKQLYTAVYEALMNAIDRIKPGVKASYVDLAIRETLREKGFPDFPYSSGHGTGMSSVDLPLIDGAQYAGRLDMELQPGMVFLLEPLTYIEGIGNCELENMILVTDSGHEVLTRTRYEDSLL